MDELTGRVTVSMTCQAENTRCLKPSRTVALAAFCVTISLAIGICQTKVGATLAGAEPKSGSITQVCVHSDMKDALTNSNTACRALSRALSKSRRLLRCTESHTQRPQHSSPSKSHIVKATASARQRMEGLQPRPRSRVLTSGIWGVTCSASPKNGATAA